MQVTNLIFDTMKEYVNAYVLENQFSILIKLKEIQTSKQKGTTLKKLCEVSLFFG